MAHYQALMPDPRKAPPTIYFNEDVVISGITPMERGRPFDEVIDRPLGMRGYILNLTVAGEGLITDGPERFVCRKGDLLLFPPHVPHYYHRHESAALWHHQWVYFFPRGYWQEALHWGTATHLVERFTLPPEYVEEFVSDFLELIARNHSTAHSSQILALNYLEKMLFRRLEIAADAAPPKLPTDHRVSLAMIYMRDNLGLPELDLPEIAAHVHLSLSHFVHLFTKTAGVSPKRWLSVQRLKAAQALLFSTTLPVEDIAQRVGIRDVGYFYRIFKQYCGMTPGEYRNAASPEGHTSDGRMPNELVAKGRTAGAGA